MEDAIDVEAAPLLNEDNALAPREETSCSAITMDFSFIAPIGILILGIIIWNLPLSHLISSISLHILSVFACVIAALLITEYSISLIVGWGLIILIATCNLMCSSTDNTFVQCASMSDAFNEALSGFSQGLSWLVLISFHLGHAVELTNLGYRISLWLILLTGQRILTLGYGIFLAEFMLGPFVPSNTARGGSIILPIVQGMTEVLDTKENNRHLGSYLVLCGSYANLISSSAFMTATIGNPMVADLAKDILEVDFAFATWFLGAIVPALCLLTILPLFFFVSYNPDYNPSSIIEGAKRDLVALGPISKREIALSIVLVGCLGFWITGKWTGIPGTFVAFTALFVLIALGVMQWKDVAENAKAWDSFFWLAIMIMLAGQITKSGLATVMGDACSNAITSMNVSPVLAALLLGLVYFFSMYLFSSITAHLIVFTAPFFHAAKSLETPPILITAITAYFSALCAALTNYGSGAQAMYFSLGFLSRLEWFRVGLYVSAIILATYMGPGLIWWKILGWF